MRIAAIPISDRRVASARLRLYSLLDALPREFSSAIYTQPAAARDALHACDLLYVQKLASREVVDLCHEARSRNLPVVYDIDDDFGVWPRMFEAEVCALASLITVDSAERAAALAPLVPCPVAVVPCMIDLAADPHRRLLHPRDTPALASFGSHYSLLWAAPWLRPLLADGVSGIVIGPPSAAAFVPEAGFLPFALDTFVPNLLRADIAVLRHLPDAFGRRKGNNRLVMAMSLGMTVIVSRTPSYLETLRAAGHPELACEEDAPRLVLDSLAHPECRREIGRRLHDFAWDHYAPARIAALFAASLPRR